MKKRLLAIALSVMVMFTIGAASSVFAAGQNTSDSVPTYSEGEANLVLYLEAPEGIDLTAETFTFNFTPANGTVASRTNDSTYVVPTDKYEATSATIKLNPAENAEDNEMASAGVEGTQNMVGAKTIASIFKNYSFPRAGEYTFKVKEQAGSTDDMTYSSEEYTLRLVVGNKNGGGTEITDVTVTDPEGKKVNPTDVDPTDNEDPAQPGVDPSPSDSLEGFTFTNLISPLVENHNEPTNPNPDPIPDDPAHPDPIPEDPQDPDNPLISKTNAFVLDKFVLGQYGDQTKDFSFNVTVKLPATNKSFDLNATGNVPTVTANKGSISEGAWADNTLKTVTLKHDGQLAFPKLPVGTTIIVDEPSVPTGYTKFMTTSQDDDALTILVTKDGGYAICRNSFDDNSITPTGILINNLPYILLILLAVGGIVVFARKRRYQ